MANFPEHTNLEGLTIIIIIIILTVSEIASSSKF